MSAGWWVLVAAAVLALVAAGVWLHGRIARHRATVALVIICDETLYLEALYQMPEFTPEHERHN